MSTANEDVKDVTPPAERPPAPLQVFAVRTTTLTTSPTIGKIAGAIAKAQVKIVGAAKSGTNVLTRDGTAVAKYSKLSDIWDACHAALNAEGVAIVQSPTFRDSVEKVRGQCIVTTLLAHESGEFLVGEAEVNVNAVGAQAAGSAITYLRRYTLAALCGVAPADDVFDDDGVGTLGPKERASAEAAAAAEKNLIKFPAVRIAELTASLNNCKTIEELQAAFTALNDDERAACLKTKDALKAKLSKGQKTGSGSAKAS